MKKVFLALLMSLFLFSGSAMAYSITYMDNTINWPGYNVDPREYIGSPQVEKMNIYIDDLSNDLEKVEIYLTNRLVWDALFINQGLTPGPYNAWDFYVEDTTMDNNTGANLYLVDTDYQYILAPYIPGWNTRAGHPAGIQHNYLIEANSYLASVIYENNILTYTFNTGITLGEQFYIGYSQWCANDPILTPEPSALIMLGLGLLGVVAIRRRRK